MKRFTMVVALSVITLLAYTQNRTDFHQKMLKMKAKTDQIVQQAGLLSKTIRFAPPRSSSLLKSAPTQKLDSIVSWTYDKPGETFIYDWRDVYQYQYDQIKPMRIVGVAEQEWDTDAKAWKTVDVTDFEYGTDDKISTLLEFELDVINDILGLVSKMEINYNADGKLESMLVSSYETGGEWKLDGENYFFYDASGRLSQWDIWALDDDEVMTKSVIIRYAYNPSGQLITQSTYGFIGDVEMLFSKSDHSYNASGQLVTTIVSGLNFVSQEMENQRRTVYQYNTVGDVTIETDSKWNGTAGTWEDDEKYEYQYGALDFSEVAFLSFGSEIFGIGDPTFMPTKAISGDKSFDMEDGLWVQTDKSTYYYSAGTSTGIEGPETSSTGFYPNPAFDEITLTLNDSSNDLKLQVFQITGAMVLEQMVSSGERVSVAHLARGIYLIKLLNGQQTVYTGKMLKN